MYDLPSHYNSQLVEICHSQNTKYLRLPYPSDLLPRQGPLDLPLASKPNDILNGEHSLTQANFSRY